MERTTTLALLAGWLACSTAAAAQTPAIAQQGPITVGGSAILTPERQARLIARTARGLEPEHVLLPDTLEADWDADFERAEAAPSGKPLATAPESFFAEPESAIQPTVAQSPSPVSVFTANRSDGSLAADTSVAASATHVIVTNRNQIGYYSKAGRQLALLSVNSLFAGLNLATLFGQNPEYHDMHCLYDGYRNRFWVGAIAFKNISDSKGNVIRKLSKFVVAVSKTTSPLDGWNLYWWDAIPGDGHPGTRGNKDGDGSDYPTWGIDSYGVYQSNPFCHLYPSPVDCDHEQLTFFPAAPLAAGAALPAGWQFWDLKGPGSTTTARIIQPALHHGSSGGATFFVSGQDPNVVVWRLRNHLTPSQILENVAVRVAPFDVPSVGKAPQKGSSATVQLDNLGNDALKAVYRGGNLYAVFNDAAAWITAGVYDASVRLVRLNVSQFPNVTVGVDRYFGGNSTYYDQPGDHIAYAWPSVEVNKNGDMVVVYGRAGSTIYPEVSYSVYPAAGPDILASRKLRVGDAPVELEDPTAEVQLHDFDGASVDPYDDTAVWIAAPYGEAKSFRSSRNWAIAVGKVYGSLVADLIVEKVGHSAVRGGGVSVTVQVRNQGDASAAPSTVTVSLRNASGAVVKTLGTIACKLLYPDQLVTLTKAFPLPTLAKGSYFVTAAADTLNVVTEYSNTNNTTKDGVAVIYN